MSLMSCMHKPPDNLAKEWFDAVKHGKVERVKSMAKRNKDYVKLQDENGATALHYAFARNNISLAKWLIEQGADIREQNFFGATPLDYALIPQRCVCREICMYGNRESVEILLKNHFFKINEINIEMTPLMYAAATGNLEVVKFLVESGADVNMLSTSRDPRPAAYFAFPHGHAETLFYLLKEASKTPLREDALSPKEMQFLRMLKDESGLSEEDRDRKLKAYIAKQMVQYGIQSPKAMEWLKNAAKNGDAEATKWLQKAISTEKDEKSKKKLQKHIGEIKSDLGKSEGR